MPQTSGASEVSGHREGRPRATPWRRAGDGASSQLSTHRHTHTHTGTQTDRAADSEDGLHAHAATLTAPAVSTGFELSPRRSFGVFGFVPLGGVRWSSYLYGSSERACRAYCWGRQRATVHSSPDRTGHSAGLRNWGRLDTGLRNWRDWTQDQDIGGDWT